MELRMGEEMEESGKRERERETFLAFAVQQDVLN